VSSSILRVVSIRRTLTAVSPPPFISHNHINARPMPFSSPVWSVPRGAPVHHSYISSVTAGPQRCALNVISPFSASTSTMYTPSSNPTVLRSFPRFAASAVGVDPPPPRCWPRSRRMPQWSSPVSFCPLLIRVLCTTISTKVAPPLARHISVILQPFGPALCLARTGHPSKCSSPRT
jgi:hypothetical protein